MSSEGTHPDAIAALKVGETIPFDKDIAPLINSAYVNPTTLMLAQIIRNQKITGKTSDGYHTFDELYEHRVRLFITLCEVLSNTFGVTPDIWMTEYHSDGVRIPDWFLLGIHKENGKQITYHIPMKHWDECLEFAERVNKAPEFDGHTSADVLLRLKSL